MRNTSPLQRGGHGRPGCLELLGQLRPHFTLCLWSVSSRRYLDKVLSFGLAGWFAETYAWDELAGPWKDVRQIGADFLVDDSPHHREAGTRHGLAEDLPKTKTVRRSRNYPHLPCPRCGKSCFRNRTRSRVLHDLGDLVAGRPRDIELVYSQHRCTKCNRFFNADTSDYALPKASYTHRVVSLAVRLVVEDGLPYQAASWHL